MELEQHRKDYESHFQEAKKEAVARGLNYSTFKQKVKYVIYPTGNNWDEDQWVDLYILFIDMSLGGTRTLFDWLDTIIEGWKSEKIYDGPIWRSGFSRKQLRMFLNS